MKQLSPPAHTAGPAEPPEPSGDTGRRRTRHRAPRAGRAGPPGTGVGSPCRPGVSRAGEPRDGPRGAAAVLSHGPDSAKPRRITPPRAAASPAEVIMVPPGCPRRGGPRGPKGPGGFGSGPVRPNRSSAAAAAARPGSAAKGLFRRLRAAPGKGARAIACAGRRRNRQAGRGQPWRRGPCAARRPSRTPRDPHGPLGAPPQPPPAPHGLPRPKTPQHCRGQRGRGSELPTSEPCGLPTSEPAGARLCAVPTEAAAAPARAGRPR